MRALFRACFSSKIVRSILAKLIPPTLLLVAAAYAASQTAAPVPAPAQPPLAGQISEPAAAPEAATPAAAPIAAPAITPAIEALLSFKDSDVKFSVSELMDILRDKRHEGWVLAAYPDPKTGRPLIGAGFSLDLPAREHPQQDPLNPNGFLEPSSAELWQAAGLDAAKLAKILDQFHEQASTWTTRQFRRDIPWLTPQISGDEADQLLRIAIVQSAINARAYCRNFDQLTASQQMAVSQLVYQMGVNLEEFTEFLALINMGEGMDAGPNGGAVPQPPHDAVYWTTVQHSLEQSQWARLYRARAVAVIAMLDPRYADSPAAAERRVSAVLRPAVSHRRRGRAVAATQLAANRGGHARAGQSKSAHSRGKKMA